LVLGASAFLAGGPALAADLGSDGVADLEERVAELEATTARKGNRKVSLTISGWVNQTVQAWDDGSESNVYVGTNGSDPTRFRFVGKAKIDKDWTAGYIIEIGVDSDRQDKATADSLAAGAFTLRHSAWFLESKTLGKVTVGLTSAVNDGITEISTASYTGGGTTTVEKPITIFTPNGAFNLRQTNGTQLGTTWDNLAHGLKGVGEGDRYNIIRYDTPEFAGFVASANWGEDDIWAVALRYKGELHGFKLAGGISYAEISDNSQGFGGSSTIGNDRGEELGLSASVLHIDSGLFVTFAYGEATLATKVIGAGKDNDYSNWNVQAGIQKKWNPLGATTVYGEYFKGDFGAATGSNAITNSEVDVWGAAAVQTIDAAALDLYIAYRHYEADAWTAPATKLSLESFDTVFSGAKISF
jgi:predicted porin